MSDYLAHYGVLGMKWGVRKDRLTMTTKSGDVISLVEKPSPKLAQFIAKYSKKSAEEQEKLAIFGIKNPNGKTVGEITLYRESKDSMNVVWLTTKDEARGRGYGTAVMKAAISIAKDLNLSSVTLEVPGDSPDAKHIYEKLGFKEVASPDSDPNDIWGGLTNMRLSLEDVKHSSPITSNAKAFLSYLKQELDKIQEQEEEPMSNELAHFGVLGMKWGVRKTPEQIAAKRASRIQKKELKRADREWGDKKRIKQQISSQMKKLKNDKDLNNKIESISKTLIAIPGITSTQYVNSLNVSVAKAIDDVWAADKSLYSPGGTHRISMTAVGTGSGVAMAPRVVKLKKQATHAAEETDEDSEFIDLAFRVDNEGKMSAIAGSFEEIEIDENTLAHYGVLGMKWGVRRAEKRALKRAAKEEKRIDNEIRKVRRSEAKKRRGMSDKELLEKIGRLEKEKKLRELTEAEIDPGRKATKDILKVVGTTVLTGVAAGTIKYAIKMALTGKGDLSDAAGYIVPKPGKK